MRFLAAASPVNGASSVSAPSWLSEHTGGAGGLALAPFDALFRCETRQLGSDQKTGVFLAHTIPLFRGGGTCWTADLIAFCCFHIGLRAVIPTISRSWVRATSRSIFCSTPTAL